MAKLDPYLTLYKTERDDGGAARMRELADDPATPLVFAAGADDSDDNPDVRVIVRFTGTVDPLVAVGFRPETVAGNTATGSIDVAALTNLEQVAELEFAEASIRVQLFLDRSVPEIRADQVHSGPPGWRGSNVVVGIVDSGIDFTHSNFRDASSGTRIKRVWDQNLTPQAGESNPSGYSYGVEYDDADINTALADANPFSVVRHQDDPNTGNHGTHVAGISAGDGSEAGNNQPASTYIGVAPEADIVVVATNWGTAGIIDGVNYVFQVATALNKPAVVNLSLGSVIGPHDGTSNFEQGITNLITGQGRVVVAAAGNEAADNAHASGTVTANATVNLPINVPNNRQARVDVDLWYNGADVFGVVLLDPAGNVTGNVAVGNQALNNMSGTTAFVQHSNNDPNNGDKRVSVVLQAPVGGTVAAGQWQLQLTGTNVNVGTFDSWIRNPPGQPNTSFGAFATATGTIGSPATAIRVVSVGSYVTRGPGLNSLSTFSNRGPTRDGRPTPDISAPGQRIISANVLATSPYQTMSGTSMATPHIAGVVALMLQKNRSYTWEQVRDCLRNTARADTFTGLTPNNAWGWGKVDAPDALNCVASPVIVTRAQICITRTPNCPTRPPRCMPITRQPYCRTRLPQCQPLTRAIVCRTRPHLCPPLTRQPSCLTRDCPPLTREPSCFTRVNCPPLTRMNCPQTRLECPEPTRFGCPEPTRLECPEPTRFGCPEPTRAGCPPISRVCGRPGLPRSAEAYGPYEEYHGASDYGYAGDQAAYEEGYAQGYQDALSQGYGEAYGTYESGSGQGEPTSEEFYEYDEQWFDNGEFE